MIPILPYNPFTIAPMQWFTNTKENVRARLTQLRRLDTFYRCTDAERESEKKVLGKKLASLTPAELKLKVTNP